jgi:tetratricopeptide (TPR) repeat protein
VPKTAESHDLSAVSHFGLARDASEARYHYVPLAMTAGATRARIGCRVRQEPVSRGSAECRRRGAGWPTFAAVIAIAFAAGCRQSTVPPNGEARPRTATVRPVPLPDLSRASPPFQAQLRDLEAAIAGAQQGAPVTEQAQAYGRLGTVLMAADLLDAAEVALLDANALDSTAFRWRYLLGHLYRKRGDSVKASEWFARAREVEPDDTPTLVWLGRVELAAGHEDAAEALFNRALTLQPRSAAALFGLGLVALARHDFTRTVDQLEAALAIEPQATAVHYPLAMAYRGRGEAAQAEAHLRQRGDVEPAMADPLLDEVRQSVNSAIWYAGLGRDALARGQWTEALTQLQKGLELAGDNGALESVLRQQLGTALYQLGDRQQALTEFRRAASADPRSSKAQYSLGVMLEAGGDIAQALEHYAAAVRAEPGYVDARLQRAKLLEQTGRVQEALVEFDAILKRDPRIADAALGSAIALARLGRRREAADRLKEAIADHPNRPDLASALEALRRPR